MVLTILLPHCGPNRPAARSLDWAGWPFCILAAWLTLRLTGYHNPITRSLHSVGLPSGSVARCLTLPLCGYRCPIVGIPFAAVLSSAVLLLHLCPDGPTTLVHNVRLYTVWAICPCFGLPGKKVFIGFDHVTVLENTTWVRVLADLLRVRLELT